MEKVSIKNLSGEGITLAAVIHFPAGFDAGAQYPAIVVSHPGGGVFPNGWENTVQDAGVLK